MNSSTHLRNKKEKQDVIIANKNTQEWAGFASAGVVEEGEGSLLSSLPTAASDSGFKQRSHSAIRTERMWRSNPVSSMFDIWNDNSRESRAMRAAPESICSIF